MRVVAIATLLVAVSMLGLMVEERITRIQRVEEDEGEQLRRWKEGKPVADNAAKLAELHAEIALQRGYIEELEKRLGVATESFTVTVQAD